jgi:hypothetical protein|tara:strand:- start:245 stop:733 length:489 start_codon:yes stop_codon:yes gene_type:complete
MTNKNKKIDESREPREAQTREKKVARKPWAPPSALDAPNPPEGYVHRWVRLEIRGQDDRKNVMARLREGWEPVRADEYPDFESPVVEEGKFEGVIGVGGLILCRIPIETVQERDAFFASKTQNQMDAVDNDMMRDGSHPSMSISRPERQSRVTIGGTQGSSE